MADIAVSERGSVPRWPAFSGERLYPPSSQAPQIRGDFSDSIRIAKFKRHFGAALERQYRRGPARPPLGGEQSSAFHGRRMNSTPAQLPLLQTTWQERSDRPWSQLIRMTAPIGVDGSSPETRAPLGEASNIVHAYCSPFSSSMVQGNPVFRRL
jgi:hypothetical protein